MQCEPFLVMEIVTMGKHSTLYFYVYCIPFHLTYSPLQFQIVHCPLNIFPLPIAIFIPYF